MTDPAGKGVVHISHGSIYNKNSLQKNSDEKEKETTWSQSHTGKAKHGDCAKMRACWIAASTRKYDGRWSR